jgi:hypothetical protein
MRRFLALAASGIDDLNRRLGCRATGIKILDAQHISWTKIDIIRYLSRLIV